MVLRKPTGLKNGGWTSRDILVFVCLCFFLMVSRNRNVQSWDPDRLVAGLAFFHWQACPKLDGRRSRKKLMDGMMVDGMI